MTTGESIVEVSSPPPGNPISYRPVGHPSRAQTNFTIQKCDPCSPAPTDTGLLRGGIVFHYEAVCSPLNVVYTRAVCFDLRVISVCVCVCSNR